MSLSDLQGGGGKKLEHLIDFSLFNTWMDEPRVEHTHNLGGCSLLCVGMIDHVCHPIMAVQLSSRFNDDKRDLISTRLWTECPQVIHTRKHTFLSLHMMPMPCSKRMDGWMSSSTPAPTHTWVGWMRPCILRCLQLYARLIDGVVACMQLSAPPQSIHPAPKYNTQCPPSVFLPPSPHPNLLSSLLINFSQK